VAILQRNFFVEVMIRWERAQPSDAVMTHYRAVQPSRRTIGVAELPKQILAAIHFCTGWPDCRPARRKPRCSSGYERLRIQAGTVDPTMPPRSRSRPRELPKAKHFIQEDEPTRSPRQSSSVSADDEDQCPGRRETHASLGVEGREPYRR